MIKLFKENYNILKISIFGCRLDLKTIFMHIFYNLIFKIKNILIKKNYKNHQINNHINTFLEYGYLKLENVISDSLFNTINQKYLKLLDKEEYLSANTPQNILRIKDCLINIPELKEILNQNEIKMFLSNYFNGDFKIYYCDIQRLYKEKNSSNKIDNNSLKWHFDNCPKSLIKLMIYLVDVNKENAAISLLNKKLSLKLKSEGYWDRETQRNEKMILKYDIDNQAKSIEGRKKAGVFFSTHYCLHRANVPLTDNLYRDAIVFLIGPSLKKYVSQINIEKDRILSDSENFSFKPF